MGRVGPAVAGLAAVLLTGCALPDGVDGDLTGAWGAVTEPVVFEPDPDTCHDQHFTSSGTLSDYDPVPCEQRHRLETIHIGTFDDEAAVRIDPPPDGSPELVDAYQECDAEAAEFLGADFRHGRLWLGVVRPTRDAWEGGARWFRCDLGVWADHDGGGDLSLRQGSLRDALTEDSNVALGCYDPEISDDDDGIEKMNPVSCDQPHTAEFVGVWTSSDTSYLDFDVEDDRNRIHRGCRSAVADYVDVPDDGDMRFRTGTIATGIAESDWEAGDRGFRCYLWLSREVSESLAGAGTSGLPIQTG